MEGPSRVLARRSEITPMPVAIFGITNDALNVAASLIILMLVALYFALVVYTFFDARRRISDPVIITCATVGSLIPFIGTAVYVILRPPEFLEDARERRLEIKAAELRVRQLGELSCPNCDFPVEKNYLRCPNCERRLKDPCHSCGKPVDPRWQLCPYCENALPGRARAQRERGEEEEERPPQRRPQRQPQRQGAPRPSSGRPAPERQAQAAAQRQQRPRQQAARTERPDRPESSARAERPESAGPREPKESAPRTRQQPTRAPASDEER